MKLKTIITWAARLVASLILLQTLYFKFSAAPESVYIFTQVGIEPWGRIGTGILELIAGLALLITGLSWLGAILALGLMVGAIGTHLTLLGVEVQGDGGYLFLLACVVTVCSAWVLYSDRERAYSVWKKMVG
jgi:uncharacterized membrane protein YphA (DoxX/SURF4 family)